MVHESHSNHTRPGGRGRAAFYGSRKSGIPTELYNLGHRATFTEIIIYGLEHTFHKTHSYHTSTGPRSCSFLRITHSDSGGRAD